MLQKIGLVWMKCRGCIPELCLKILVFISVMLCTIPFCPLQHLTKYFKLQSVPCRGVQCWELNLWSLISVCNCWEGICTGLSLYECINRASDSQRNAYFQEISRSSSLVCNELVKIVRLNHVTSPVFIFFILVSSLLLLKDADYQSRQSNMLYSNVGVQERKEPHCSVKTQASHSQLSDLSSSCFQVRILGSNNHSKYLAQVKTIPICVWRNKT